MPQLVRTVPLPWNVDFFCGCHIERPLPIVRLASIPMIVSFQASLSKPSELNPPIAKQEDFKKKFGISWDEALKAGLVYNAVDGCKKLGIGGAVMDAKWAKAKKDGALIKFGGGFYAGRIPMESVSPSSWASPLLLGLYALFAK